MSEVELHLGDCLEILPAVGIVDCVVTDPPYGISQQCELTTSGMRRYGRVNFGEWDDEFPISFLKYVNQICRGTFYIFCPYQVLGELYIWAKDSGLQQRVLWWKKTNPARRNGNVYWSIPGEHIFYAKKSGATFNSAYEIGYFEHSVVHRRNHPTQKPLEVIKKFIVASTNPGDTVLDPFMGSGTTGVACVQLNRNFIGIEIEKKYYDIAEKRIKQAQRQMVMEL